MGQAVEEVLVCRIATHCLISVVGSVLCSIFRIVWITRAIPISNGRVVAVALNRKPLDVAKGFYVVLHVPIEGFVCPTLPATLSIALYEVWVIRLPP